MKASSILIAASAGVALAQPTSLVERASSVCPIPFTNIPACCQLLKFDGNLPYLACFKAESANTEQDFIQSCQARAQSSNLETRPQCCSEPGISQNDHAPSLGPCIRPPFAESR